MKMCLNFIENELEELKENKHGLVQFDIQKFGHSPERNLET